MSEQVQLLILTAALLASSAAAIRPLRLGRLSINIVSLPLVLTAVLLLAGVLAPADLLSGLRGQAGIRPWEILVIFFSVAYVSISVDLSGILDYFAFRILALARGSTLLLFFFFYGFAGLLTVFTSNDIVILTLTPIIFYLRRHGDVDVVPLLFAEFFAANTMSMLLYIGNPTNIIIGNAMGLDFLEYSQVMALPTLAAGLGNLLLLWLMFRRRLSRGYTLDSGSMPSIRSPYDAIASSSLLFIMLGLLMASQKLDLAIWQITLAFALLYFMEDVLIGLFHAAAHPGRYLSEISSDMKKIYSLYGFPSNRYDVFVILRRIPWKILPFLALVFILIARLHGLGASVMTGELLATLAGRIQELIGQPAAAGNPAVPMLLNGWIALILSNIINNQPASILYSYLLAAGFPMYPGETLRLMSYAVIAASNLGANLTLMGALAGVMWDRILREKGVIISYGEFMLRGLAITPAVFMMVLLVILMTAG